MVFRVASFGDLVIDIVIGIPSLPAEADQHQLLDYVRFEPGGAGNFLITGQRLGMQMRAGGVVGEDIFGELILHVLGDEGVDISHVQRLPDSLTTTVFVLIDRAGRHVFLGRSGAGPALQPGAWVEDFLREVRALQLWGYTFMETALVTSMLYLAEEASSRNIPIFFDPGPRLCAPIEQIKQLLALTRVVLLTEAEVPSVTGGVSGPEGIGQLFESGPEVVVLKQGEKGCTVHTQKETIVVPGFAVPLRDTTAAGDSFAAAFIYGYLHGWSLEQAAVFANATGAAKVQKIGSGRQVPTAEEVRQVLHAFRVNIDF